MIKFADEVLTHAHHQALIVRIPDIEKHPNADTLGIVRILGYQLIVKLGEFQPGDLAVFIPPDSVVPQEEEFAFMWADRLVDLADATAILDYEIPVKYRRVIPRKFRKEWSEGLLLPVPEWVGDVREGMDIAEILGVEHYNPPEPEECLAGPRKKRSGWPRSLKGWWYWLLELLGFHPNGDLGGRNQNSPDDPPPVYDVEAYKNYPGLFQPGEMVVVTEKIHGSNARYTFRDDKMYAGSRTMWKHPDAKCVWRDALTQNPAIETWCRAHPGFTLFGEVVPTQGEKFNYGCEPGQVRFFLFDVMDAGGQWLSPVAQKAVQESLRLQCSQTT